jgi:hypothetical protein
MKERLTNGDEMDAVWARKILCVFQKAGVASKTKRRIRKRRRREWKRRLWDDD